jgi:hypothetical protein
MVECRCGETYALECAGDPPGVQVYAVCPNCGDRPRHLLVPARNEHPEDEPFLTWLEDEDADAHRGFL